MKKILVVFLPVIFLSFFVSNILAVSGCPTCGSSSAPSPSPVRIEQQQEIRQQIMENNPDLGELRRKVIEKRETVREELQEKRATMAARLTEMRRERIRHFYGLITNRTQAAINRLEKLIARIESRLSKIEAEDEEIDTSEIREDIDEAKDRLAEASAALSEAKTSLEDILSTEEPKEAFADVRDLVKGIKNELISVHQILVQVIGDIKGLRVGQGEENGI